MSTGLTGMAMASPASPEHGGQAGPLPRQAITWHPQNIGAWEGPPQPEFLRCLKATAPGDRQVVWEGAQGRGLVAVVDFGEPLRRTRSGAYERWAVVSFLDSPVSIEAVRAHPVLARRFTGAGARALQGNPIRLTSEEGQAIQDVAGALPPLRMPAMTPRGREPEEEWTGNEGWPREELLEVVVSEERRLWRRLGFPEAPQRQRRLPSGLRPDLLAPGVVGDAKKRVGRHDGPAQVERYVAELSRIRPQEGPWRGVLIQHAPDLDDAAWERLEASPVEIAVWSLAQGKTGRWRAEQLR